MPVSPIYLDNNATTRVMPAALAAAQMAMAEVFGNPSSGHCTGLVARQMLTQARARTAQVLDSGEGQLIFMSGATEGIQSAVFSALMNIRQRQERGEPVGRLLVYGATEHKAVPEALKHWNAVLGLNLEVRALPVCGHGQHQLDVLAQWMADTALLCTMAANNETGVVSDLVGIERVLTAHNPAALWLVDCVQALGKLPLKLRQTRMDYATFSGHKLYGPKGIGLLYVRAGSPYTAMMAGGGQEGGLARGHREHARHCRLGRGDASAAGRAHLSIRQPLVGAPGATGASAVHRVSRRRVQRAFQSGGADHAQLLGPRSEQQHLAGLV